MNDSKISRLISTLDTPVKRGAAVVALVGAVFTIGGYISIDPTNTWYNLSNLDFDNLMRHRWRRESGVARTIFWIGLTLLVGGSLVAFTRLMDWIREGNKKS